MPTIQYGSTSIEVPEGLTDDQQLELLTDETEGVKLPSFSNPMPSNQPVDYTQTKGSSSVDPATLKDDPKWLEASKVLYKQHHGVDFDGTTEELANYGLNQISYFNYNTFDMIVNAAAMHAAKPEEKQAFLYLMDQFDHLGYSWAGAGRFIGAAATDPLTYVGLSTLGIGTAAGAAGKTMGKAAIRSALHASIEAGVAGGIQSEIKQIAKVNADGQESVDYGEVAKDTALSAAGGGVIGGALGAIGSKILKSKSGLAASPVTEPPRAMEPSLFKKATEVASEASGPSVKLGSKLEGAERLEDSFRVADTQASEAKLMAQIEAKYGPIKWEGDGKAVAETVSKEAKPDANLEAKLMAQIEAKKGPLPVEAIPELHTDPAERVFAAIKEVAPEESIASFPKTRAGVANDVRAASELLINSSKKNVEDLVTKLVNKATTPEQRILLNSAFRLSTDQLEAKAFNLWAKYKTIVDPTEKAAVFKELAKVEKMRDNVKTGDTLLSSYTGSDLSQRVGSMNTGEFRGVSDESLLLEAGIDPKIATPEQTQWAKEEYYNLVNTYMKRAESNEKIKALTTAVEEQAEAYLLSPTKQKEDFDKLMKARAELLDEKLKAAESDSSEFSLFGKGKDFGRRLINDINTAIISNAFGISTLTSNTIPSLVKTLAKPTLNWFVKGPADEAAMKEMLTFYHTMYNNIGISWQMAKASFDLERSLMMTETYANKFLESSQGTGILENRFGRALRLFPRLLSATDEFFQSLNYRGFVMGEAHYNVVNYANGKQWANAADKEAYVTSKLQEAADHMFGHAHHRADVLEWTVAAGKAKGLEGAKLNAWVKKQLDTRGFLMKEVNSESGARYVEDMLFKRKFSGKGLMSESAQKYEQLTNNYPILRTVGQLFFRTPVRVFEEGIRMTPGLNLLAPNFMNDLLGKNGQAAYARAMGESMVGFTITQWIMAQYAAGNITGSGPSDPKQKQDLEASGWEAYTIKVGGHKLVYRNLDPFVTPIKIIVNMMENASDLEHRRAIGEFSKPGSGERELLAKFGVAAMAVMRSIRDANLWDGITQVATAADKASDPEHKGMDQFLVHFLGQKVGYAVPSTVSKVSQIANPDVANPATIAQYVESKFNPASTSVAHRYDALGNVRQQSDPVGKLFGLQASTEDMRKAGRSDKEMEVLRELAKLSVASGQAFVMPTKDKTLMPGIDDLRTTMTNDGKATLYDRVNQLLKGSDLTNQLHSTLVGQDHLPVAVKVDMAKKLISTYRKDAFLKLWSSEKGLKEDYMKAKLFEAEGKAGFRDSMSLPYLTE